jgi:hypothetical protein
MNETRTATRATAEYLGRKLTAKPVKNKTTGARHFEIRCNGRFCWNGTETTADAALDMAKRYVDEAELRPAAYPDLRAA